ncbi:MAG: ECF transporter S component [Propionibacteriaceae bacterium]|jgi:energy-coupling factor transport system substrate-specific component|nr:ECF transporter S component [Propionibacteriaceae bacterium]
MNRRVILTWVLALVGIPAVIVCSVLFRFDRSYYFVSLVIIVLAMLPFFAAFEGRRPQAREIVIIATLTAIAVAGRAAFFMLPQFKPSAAIVIITGASLGRESGFIVGALTGFVSNFVFGHGPWTPWQMFAYGLLGFLAGVIFSKRLAKTSGLGGYKPLLILYGALGTFIIYGLLVDTASVMIWASSFTWSAAKLVYLSGVPFNLIHALASAVFLALLATLLTEKLARLKRRYGLFQP